MEKFKQGIRNFWSFIKWDDLFAAIIFILGTIGFSDWIFAIPGGDIIVDLRTEFIGIGITVFIIGNATEARNRAANIRAEKERLILQMGSPDTAFALEAVRQLRYLGWLQDGSMRQANLSGAKLSGADLRGTRLHNTDLSVAKLSEADLSGAILSGSKLRGTRLNMADMSGAFLHKADLSMADLNLANLNGADLSQTNLFKANLRRANLRKVNLIGANMVGACLIHSILSQANLKDADLSEAELIGAAYNKDTIWPDGWDKEKLEKAGAIELE